MMESAASSSLAFSVSFYLRPLPWIAARLTAFLKDVRLLCETTLPDNAALGSGKPGGTRKPHLHWPCIDKVRWTS